MITEALLGKLVVGTAGVITSCVGIINIINRRKKVKDGIEVWGEVTGYKTYLSNSWAYICTFTLPNGQQITAVDSVSCSNTGLQNLWKKKCGSRLCIIYNKKTPGKFVKKNEIGLVAGFGTMMLAGIGIILLAALVI